MVKTFDLNDDVYQNKKKIHLDKSILSDYNTISIDQYNDELNYKNNSFIFSLPNNKLENKKSLFISGSISQNTNYIKNKLLKEMYNYDSKHLYRIDDHIWNRDLKDISIENYDLLILDNFPFNNTDLFFIDNILNNYTNKIIYFLGPNNSFVSKILFEHCDCNYEESFEHYEI